MRRVSAARRAARWIGRGLAAVALLVAVSVGAVLVVGQGSLEAGVVRIVKGSMLWALGLRGPFLEFWGQPAVWVEANDTHAFAGGAFEVRVFQIAANGDLSPLSRIAVGGIVHDMALRGDLLYVCAGDGGLEVIDVSDSAHPDVVA